MTERPDIPRWPEQLLAGMAEIERTFRRADYIYRPRLTVRGNGYPPLACLLHLFTATGYVLGDFRSNELAAIIDRNCILITGGFND